MRWLRNEGSSLTQKEPFDAQSALDALGDAIIVIAPGWRISYLNAPWERILEVRRDDILEQDFWRAHPSLDVEPAASMIRATKSDGATRRFDLQHWVTGELRSYGIRVARGSDGCLILTLSPSFQMVKSARDRALEERNEENAALRALAKQTAEVSDTTELLAILCNAANAQCGGHGATVVSAGEHEGELVSAVGLLGPAQGRHFSLIGSLAREIFETRQVAMVEDFSTSRRPLAKRLSDIPIGPLIVAPLIAHERVLGVLVVVRDRRSMPFTTREAQRLGVVADHAALALWKSQLLEQAREADRAKGRFLATMSHELRTPLTALAGYEELLVDEVLGTLSNAQREVLERMHYVTQHLSAMIEDVLAYTNLETGGEVVRATDFLAADLLSAAAAVVQPLSDQKKIAIVSESVAMPIRMTTDADKARQILVNLAGNAIKFTERGEVRLSLSTEDDEVRFSVSDTGIGIANSDLQRLFRPFSQLDSGLTRRHGGTGLGLYISQRFARLLGGRIEVESEVGKGSTFTLVLPRE
ncbi:MAG TPA: ATP-binding protein [Gemmatimonadaceae bacterium]|nr:ATP-binding protein [Gemmatimonadaceae bacterium]